MTREEVIAGLPDWVQGARCFPGPQVDAGRANELVESVLCLVNGAPHQHPPHNWTCPICGGHEYTGGGGFRWSCTSCTVMFWDQTKFNAMARVIHK